MPKDNKERASALRIGFFGGSFDPPHLGHLAVATAAVREFALDRLLLAPTGQQPLKAHGTSASFQDRLAMVELLCAGEPALEASDLDAPLPDGRANYTIDTLQRLRATVHANDAIYVVVGADAFLDLRRWRSPDALLAAAEWIVVSRPGVVIDDFSALSLTSEQRARVHVLDDVCVPVSATEIRALLSRGGGTAAMLPPEMRRYIEEHHLYGT